MIKKQSCKAQEAEIQALKERNVGLLKRVHELSREVDVVKDAGLAIVSERDKLKKMVREQTEADLLINALKATGIIRPKITASNALAEQQRLSAMQQMANSYNTELYGGALVGLGAYAQSILP